MKTKNVTRYITIPCSIHPVLTISYIVLSICNAVLPIAIMLATADFLDYITTMGGHENRYTYAGIKMLWLLLSILATHICKVITEYVSSMLMLCLSKSMRMKIVEKKSKMPLWVLEEEEHCDFMERVSKESETRFYSGMANLLQLAEYTVRGVGFLIIVGRTMPVLSILFAFVAYLLFKIALTCGQEDYSAFKKTARTRRYAREMRLMLCSRENAEERSLFSYGPLIKQKWKKNMKEANDTELKAVRRNTLHTKAANIVTVLISMTVALVLIVPMQAGKLTIGLYLALVQQVMNLVETLTWQLNPLLEEFEENRNYMEDYIKFCALEEMQNQHGSLKLEDVQEIRLENVTFCYPETEKVILKDFTYTFYGKKSYAIVGVNGAGKTTLMKLILGFYDNYEGNIFLNGQNIRNLDLEELRRHFAVVYQDFARFPITIREFLSLGEEKAGTDEEKEKILKELKLWNFIEKLPLQLDTPLGKLEETGVDLSGGQWQKLAIARCMLSKASVRILDEPTSAIDPVSEAKLHDTFESMSRDFLTITVTHRLGLAKKLSEVVVISNGSVAESGSHAELLHKKGIYAEMYETQKRWYQDEAVFIS